MKWTDKERERWLMTEVPGLLVVGWCFYYGGLAGILATVVDWIKYLFGGTSPLSLNKEGLWLGMCLALVFVGRMLIKRATNPPG